MIAALSAVAAAVGLAFSAGAVADTLSKADYKAAKKTIAADYKYARESCDMLAGNAKDICVAGAKGRENVALAELAASNQPSAKARYEVRIAKAEAVYSLAAEKCDDLAGNPKDVCLKEAGAVRTAAKADAKAQDKIAGVHKDAALEKREAEYSVAKEKCDALAGNPKDVCLGEAKARYGRS